MSCGSTGKESTCNAGDLGSIPGLRRSPGEGKGYPLQYSGLENPTLYCIVHEVSKSWTRLSDFHFHFSVSSSFLVVTRVKNSLQMQIDIRDAGSTPGSGRSPGGEHSNPFQYSCLENPMDGGAL